MPAGFPPYQTQELTGTAQGMSQHVGQDNTPWDGRQWEQTPFPLPLTAPGISAVAQLPSSAPHQ